MCREDPPLLAKTPVPRDGILDGINADALLAERRITAIADEHKLLESMSFYSWQAAFDTMDGWMISVSVFYTCECFLLFHSLLSRKMHPNARIRILRRDVRCRLVLG
jgi:hypothetical protein